MSILKELLRIYTAFFKIGLISFGGGYAMLPVIEREIVDEKKWIDRTKMADIFAVAGSLPGAVALNTSAFVGYSLMGVKGMLVAVVGNITPSATIVLTLSIIYTQIKDSPLLRFAFRGIYPVIIAMVLYAALRLGKNLLKDSFSILLAMAAFVAALYFKIDPLIIILFGAITGYLYSTSKSLFIISKGGRSDT